VTQARRRTTAAPAAAASQVHVRRAYADGRHGQLHLTTAYPSGGGFDERTPLICLHPAGSSGSWFRLLLPELGKDRSVYAPDLPAHGQSDPTTGALLGVTDYIAAMGDFIDSMRLRTVDLLGHGLGAAVAGELATQRPGQVRRVVVVADEAGNSAQAGSRTARTDSSRIATLTQPVLLLYPKMAGATQKRPDAPGPLHTVKAVPHTVEDLYGSQVKELARVLHGFLDG
jgi:pimeloyl-ACP methyl ester carboxylesterase